MSIEDKIKNSELLVETIGKFPTFHDSEVVQIVLDRGCKPTLLARIYVLKLLGKQDNEAHFDWCRYLVELRFSDIAELALRGFGHQNVLSDLYIEELADNDSGATRYEVVFEYCYGVEAIFTCSEIAVDAVSDAELIKHNPPDEQTLQERQRFVEEHLRMVRGKQS
jgi:hypothetical protein